MVEGGRPPPTRPIRGSGGGVSRDVGDYGRSIDDVIGEKERR